MSDGTHEKCHDCCSTNGGRMCDNSPGCMCICISCHMLPCIYSHTLIHELINIHPGHAPPHMIYMFPCIYTYIRGCCHTCAVYMQMFPLHMYVYIHKYPLHPYVCAPPVPSYLCHLYMRDTSPHFGQRSVCVHMSTGAVAYTHT